MEHYLPDQRATRALIDLDQLTANVTRLTALLRPGTRVMAVVKANAYGHGAPLIATAALAAGANALAVATVQEGRQLRVHGIEAPILVLSPVAPAEVSAALKLDLELTVATDHLADAVIHAATPSGHRARVHLKVDTGMHRNGADPDLAIALAQRLSRSRHVALTGVMTHFHSADELDFDATGQQAATFGDTVAAITAAGIDPGIIHAANSAAAIRVPELHFHQVRFGIALYGLAPSPVVPLPPGVRPVLSLTGRLMRVHTLGAGDRVGYGGTFVAAGGEQVGLVAIGYADGYRRGLSGRGWMAAAGQRLPVLGRVSMDQTTVLLPDAPHQLAEDDPISILGGDAAAPTADDLAALTGTINYEIVTGLANRLPRHYLRHGKVIAVTSLSDIGPMP